MSRIIIGALSCMKYPERQKRCRGTWFADAAAAGLDAVFLLGSDSHDPHGRRGDRLTLAVPAGYQELPQRTRAFCRWALSQPGWDYLFKCDDDTYVSIPRLAAYDLAGRDYIGAEWAPGVNYGSGGAGYFLSRKAAAIVAERLTMALGAEDLLVGQVLRTAGVNLSIDQRFIPYGSWEQRPARGNDVVTVHGVSADVFLASHAETGLTAS